ncbi:hypothetical protein FA15DRAFT_642543 [Coprinopsis marcescibilis]|uniref:Uncharacterized protein n=1 Tax=Coprinopsis marcescibilis TaxID=230819 RepID=A0A5C3KSI8_COPMA|nr:hypothetical protein FA15DRAFT_642543 [Coprinopsis marcescibilis]
MFSKFISRLTLLFAVHSLLVAYVLGACLPCTNPTKRLANLRQGDSDSALARRTVYSPKITTPNERTVWTVGSYVDVVWDLSEMPANITNPNGTLVLGYMSDADKYNEHLDLSHPLAKDFDLRHGRVTFKVPKVSSRADYIVVLMGDSGNASPKFTIEEA